MINNNNNDSILLMQATNFAATKHTNQRRKNEEKTPYIEHPIEVACILAQYNITDVNILVSALLHDTIEDTKTTYEEIEKIFGPKIAKIVQECTDNKSLDKITRKKLQIEHASHISYEAACVKLADKYSNVSGLLICPPKFWSQEEINGYAVWAYVACTTIFSSHKILMESPIKSDFDKLFQQFGITGITEEESIL